MNTFNLSLIVIDYTSFLLQVGMFSTDEAHFNAKVPSGQLFGPPRTYKFASNKAFFYFIQS